MPEPQAVQVCFFTQDTGLAEAVARALGDGFFTRTTTELRFDMLRESLNATHVLLIDLRSSNAQGADEAGLQLMAKVNEIPHHPPMVVLFDENERLEFEEKLSAGALVDWVQLILSKPFKVIESVEELEREVKVEELAKIFYYGPTDIK